MRIVDELYDKKVVEIHGQQIFDKWWDSRGKYIMSQILCQLMLKSDDKHYCVDLSLADLFDDNIKQTNANHSFYNYQPLYFKMLRSKLWNEGINMKVDLDFTKYFSIKNSDDKYNDCIIFISKKEKEYIINNPGTLTALALFADISSEKMLNLIQKKYYKNQNQKNKKSKSKKIKSIQNRLPSISGTDMTIVDQINVDLEMDGLKNSINTIDYNVEPLEIMYDD